MTTLNQVLGIFDTTMMRPPFPGSNFLPLELALAIQAAGIQLCTAFSKVEVQHRQEHKLDDVKGYSMVRSYSFHNTL